MIADPLPIIEVNGKQIPKILSFSLSVNLLEESDLLEFKIPPSAWKILAPNGKPTDQTIQVRFGPLGNVQFTGSVYLATINTNDEITVRCYDRMKRLVAETITPYAGYRLSRGSLKAEIEKLARPIFRNVVFSNAQDRVLRRQAKRGLSRTFAEPVSRSVLKAIGGVVSGGTKRMSAINKILEPLELICWSSANGQDLIVAKPNYRQKPQYRFIHGKQSNVLSMDTSLSIESRYSKIVFSGSGRNPGLQPPVYTPPGVPKLKRVVTRSLGVAVDTTGDFQEERVLFVVDTNSFPEEAQAKAERLLGQQTGRARPVSISVAGYGQEINGGLVLYAPDTIATVKRDLIDFSTGEAIEVVNSSYYVTSVTFSESQGSGPQTNLELVPTGTPLV